MGLSRKITEQGKVLTIELGEMFNFSTVKDFKNAYSDGIEKVETVVVDLNKTEYMDSSALGMLLNMQKVLQDQVNAFKIINAGPKVAKILEISRFDKKFDITEADS